MSKHFAMPSFRALALGLGLGVSLLCTAPAGASEMPKPPKQVWSFDGVLGSFDRAALRRGLIVYTEVCASCHALKQVAYRHLAGVGFSEAEIKSLAAKIKVQDGPNDQGEMFERAGRPSDRFPSPFPNEQAARAANGGAYPPDLSLMVKARKDGANYMHALMVGYQPAPGNFKLNEGMHYNTAFPGHQIAMPAPLAEGRVSYPDNTPASVDRMSRDVTTFLAWAAEPELEVRKRMGIKVILFLIVLTGMLYGLKRMIWAKIH